MPRHTGKTPTLKDVAKAANVSEMTASRALRNAADVSEKTRLKVLTATQKLGYVPNKIAGALASNSVNLVGVIVPSLSSFVFPEVLSGISSVLKTSALQPVIGVTEYSLETEEHVVREMLSWRPKGIILAGLEHTDNTRQMLHNASVPVVEVMDTDGDPVDFCVGVSHYGAGKAMAGAITKRGYKKIGFVGSKMPLDFRAQKRLSGFTDGLKATGITLFAKELYTGGSSISVGRSLTDKMLSQNSDIECIYYSSDVLSVGGLMHCLDKNISIPRDLAIAGFNGLDILDGLPVELATADSSRFQIGEHAAKIVLFGKIDGYDVGVKILDLQPSIKAGSSI